MINVLVAAKVIFLGGFKRSGFSGECYAFLLQKI